jgi:hypothetical protein
MNSSSRGEASGESGTGTNPARIAPQKVQTNSFESCRNRSTRSPRPAGAASAFVGDQARALEKHLSE